VEVHWSCLRLVPSAGCATGRATHWWVVLSLCYGVMFLK
jgi:hypothetical protein